MTVIFGELDFRLSVVQRWAVVSTIRKQSVAEHSFNVAILSERIAREWFHYTKEADLYLVLRRALYHDWRESITGDPPSYMKFAINETQIDAIFSDYIDEYKADINVGAGREAEIIRFIVKAADYIDALIFLQMEISHGNRSIFMLMRDLEKRFRAAMHEAAVTVSAEFDDVWENYVEQIREPLFGTNGQYSTEAYRFK